MKKAEPTITADKVCQHLIDRFNLLDGTRIVVAYSGGLDSHVLLHALATSSARARWALEAIHINHGLQPQADAWANHCRIICEQLAVPITIKKITVTDSKLGIEAQARQQRYACMHKIIQHNDCLLTAHHQQDQAETVLLHLMRGSGIQGLAAIPPERSFSSGRLIRPLLDFEYQAIVNYGQLHQLKWIEDGSNTQTRFGRNFIRQQILPMLKRRWPQANLSLSRAAAHAAEATEILEQAAINDYQACVMQNDTALSIPLLKDLQPPRLHNVLRYWIKHSGLQYPSQKQLSEIVKLLVAGRVTGKACVKWSTGEVHRFKNGLYVMPRLQAVADQQMLNWQFDQTLAIPGGRYMLSAMQTKGEGLAVARLQSKNVTVGFRQGGERCRLPGRRHHHKLKNLMQASLIPPWLRQRIPLIYVDNELAAIGDRWVCQPYAALPGEPSLKMVLRSGVVSNKT